MGNCIWHKRLGAWPWEPVAGGARKGQRATAADTVRNCSEVFGEASVLEKPKPI